MSNWFPFNFFTQHQDQTPSYRGVETRRQSSVDNRSRPPFNPSASILIDRGLINKPGENNCFLNTAVQILWHTDVFRRSFRKFEGHACDGETCIFCALKVLFTQYQYSGQFALPPDALRVAMSECYESQQKFQLGLMDDAAECFEKILEQIHYNLTASNDLDVCSTPWCISHQKFALTTVEQTVCQCRANSEPLTFVEFVHYVTTSLIVNQSERFKKEGRLSVFDQCLHIAGSTGGNARCQNFPKCQMNVFYRRTLLNAPDVVCIGFIWDSESPPLSYIMSVVESIDTEIRPSRLFDQVVSDKIRDVKFHLTAMITYYGRHYSTYCFHSHKKEWIYFDDAKFRKAGKEWSSVVEECRKAHFQPLLLVYTRPDGVAVDTTQAPTQVTMTSSHSQNGTQQTEPNLTTSTTVDVKSNSLSPSDEDSPRNQQQPYYMNVPSQGSPQYVNIKTSPEPSNGNNDQTLLYDDVRSGRTRPPTVQKQEHVADLIEFSLTPAAIASSTSSPSSNVLDRTDPVASRGGISGNPFMIQDSKILSKDGTKPGFQHVPGVVTDDVNLRDSSQGKRDFSKGRLYKSPATPTASSQLMPSPQPQQTTPTSLIDKKQQATPKAGANFPSSDPTGGGIRSPTNMQPTMHDTSAINSPLQTSIRGKRDFSKGRLYKSPATPTASSQLMPSSQQQQTTPTSLIDKTQQATPKAGANFPSSDPTGGGIRSPTNMQPRMHDTSAINSPLQTSIRGLPKNIRDAILHAGLCLAKARETTDRVMIAILLDSAGSQIQRVLNMPSIAANQSLQSHLRSQKEAIQKEQLKLECELSNARYDSLAIQAVLSNEELNFERPQVKLPNNGSLQTCLECNQRRICDESLLCGPCRLKLRLQH